MTLAAIIAALSAWQPLGYFAIFSGLLLEGDLIIFSAMFLTNEGVFKLPIMIPVIIGAAITNDVLWYKLGKITRGKNHRLLKMVERIASPLDDLIARYPTRMLTATKFVYGLMRPTLMRLGMLNMPLSNFLRRDIPATLLWVCTVGSIGYFTSASLYYIKHYFRMAEITMLAAFLIFMCLWHFIGRNYIKKL